MGYNKKNYLKVKQEYEEKKLAAEKRAAERKLEVHAKYPDIKYIDDEIAKTALKIVEEISKGNDGIRERIEAVKEGNLALRKARGKLLEHYGFGADYTDVKYECPLCSDTGYLPNCSLCSCMKVALARAGYESSGIGRLMETQSFDSFSLEYYKNDQGIFRMMKSYFEKCRAYAEDFSEKTTENLLFIGGTGLGKTHLSTSVAALIIGKGYDVVYESAQNIFREYEAERFGRGSAASTDIERYIDCDLLIMDDLGAESSNSFTVSCLYNIINSRITLGRPMIINTNLGADEISKRYTDRIFSRLMGEFTLMRFAGKDVRMQKLGMM